MDRAPLSPTASCRAPRAAALALVLASFSCFAEDNSPAAEPVADTAAAGPPAPASEPGAQPEIACPQPEHQQNALVDKMQRGVYVSVCSTTHWFDGLFGTRRYDQDSDETFGRLGLYELWDDRDGFNTKLRMRVRLALPAMKQRMRLVFGRVEDREVVEESQPNSGSSVPSSFQRVEDEAWLLGLGYSKQGKLESGFDFGAGIRIRTPVDPFVKGTYRHNFIFSTATALRARETLFWRDSRGYGQTTEVTLDHLLTPKLLLRWNNYGTIAEDLRRLEWGSGVTAFQSVGTRRAIAYTGFVSGVANTAVPLRNYGVEVRYRRQILRKWLFLEARSSLTWPKESVDEERDINPGLGIGFEMYFGPVPEQQLR